MAKCGGTGDEQAATAEIQAIADAVKGAVQEKLGADTDLGPFKAVAFKTQVVAGTNYFIKIQTGGESFAHARVFKPLPHAGDQPQLADAKKATGSDALDYF
eukprot:Hpha_TRINITY_DN2200_c0_g1::TRINITY_DN2200_c0_g1_i1::g.25510::m.25510/K13907/CSTA_B; cystatin-A/B